MKRRVTWLIGLVGVVTFFVFLWSRGQNATLATVEAAKEQAAKPAAAAAASQSTPAPSAKAGQPSSGESQPGGEKIVYKFDDQSKVDDFTKLWQQRQGIVLRMTVLQAYWNEEKVALDQINKTLSDTYKLDTTKNYFLDSQRRVLVEREAPAASPAVTSGQPTTATQGAPSKP